MQNEIVWVWKIPTDQSEHSTTAGTVKKGKILISATLVIFCVVFIPEGLLLGQFFTAIPNMVPDTSHSL
jgi:hypothetical protein